MKTLITTVALAMLFAISANADVIHQSDFEAEPTTGFGIVTTTMGFNDAGGDLIGFSNNGGAGSTGDALGISSTNPNSGSFHYAVDAGATAAAGNGWGGSWSGQTSNGGSGGFTDMATAVANGAGCYVDISEGATFTVSAMIATDAADPLTGGANAHVRLEFNGATADVIPRVFSPNLVATTITPGYQMLTATYTLTAADVALGITEIVGAIGTDGHGDGTTDGMIYADDFLFEVDAAHVVLVGDGHAAIPEPSTASLLLAGLLGLCGVRRRKS